MNGIVENRIGVAIVKLIIRTSAKKLKTANSVMTRKAFLLIEFLVLFLGIPCAFFLMGHESIKIVIPVLFTVAIYCVWQLLRDRSFDSKSLFSLRIPGQHFKPIVVRFAVGGIGLSAVSYLIAPEQFLAFPKNNLELWCAVMLLYPLLSVYPQELIFRSFMFQRYRSLIQGNYMHMILISGFLFSFSHLLFNNWQALALTALGGCIIAYTYHRSNSVICASFEHAIWGNLIFTIGLGKHFSGGTIANLLYGSSAGLGF